MEQSIIQQYQSMLEEFQQNIENMEERKETMTDTEKELFEFMKDKVQNYMLHRMDEGVERSNLEDRQDYLELMKKAEECFKNCDSSLSLNENQIIMEDGITNPEKDNSTIFEESIRKLS